MICDHRNFIFVRVAKTGSSSIIKVLFPKKTWRRRTKVNDWEKFDPNLANMTNIQFQTSQVASQGPLKAVFKGAQTLGPP